MALMLTNGRNSGMASKTRQPDPVCHAEHGLAPGMLLQRLLLPTPRHGLVSYLRKQFVAQFPDDYRHRNGTCALVVDSSLT